MTKTFTVLSFVLLLLVSLRLPLLHASDYMSPRTAALGGAGHAGPLLNDSILLNPSYVSFLPTFALSMNYLNFSGRSSNETNRYYGRNYNISMQDGRSELFQAGASFTKRENISFLHIGAAKSVIKKTGFGLGVKYYRIATAEKTETTGYDFTLSSTWLISNWIQAAFIADNLLETNEQKNQGLNREFILAFKVIVRDIFVLYLDPHFTPSLEGKTFGYETGIEFILMRDLFLRAGTMRNSSISYENSNGRGYGVGLGWVAPKISIDLAMSRALEPQTATAYTFGTTIYF